MLQGRVYVLPYFEINCMILNCVFMCGLEMKCDFLIEITASSFLGNRELETN